MAETHTVRPGDCMASIAKQYRFADYRTIHDHARNARLKSQRPTAAGSGESAPRSS